jgi:hypothetical protein
MQEYEIRILRDNCTAVIKQRHLNNNAAIRSAQKLAGKQRFEVWSGLSCVYGLSPSARPHFEFSHPRFNAHP